MKNTFLYQYTREYVPQCIIYIPYHNTYNTLQALELTPFFLAKKHAKSHSEDHMYACMGLSYYIDVMDTSIRDVFLGIAAALTSRTFRTPRVCHKNIVSHFNTGMCLILSLDISKKFLLTSIFYHAGLWVRTPIRNIQNDLKITLVVYLFCTWWLYFGAAGLKWPDGPKINGNVQNK